MLTQAFWDSHLLLLEKCFHCEYIQGHVGWDIADGSTFRQCRCSNCRHCKTTTTRTCWHQARNGFSRIRRPFPAVAATRRTQTPDKLESTRFRVHLQHFGEVNNPLASLNHNRSVPTQPCRIKRGNITFWVIPPLMCSPTDFLKLPRYI